MCREVCVCTSLRVYISTFVIYLLASTPSKVYIYILYVAQIADFFGIVQLSANNYTIVTCVVVPKSKSATLDSC